MRNLLQITYSKKFIMLLNYQLMKRITLLITMKSNLITILSLEQFC